VKHAPFIVRGLYMRYMADVAEPFVAATWDARL